MPPTSPASTYRSTAVARLICNLRTRKSSVQTIYYDSIPVPEDAVRFQAPSLRDDGSNGHYLLVPFDVKAQWNQARPAVWAQFAGRVTYRGTLVKYGRPQHMLLIRKEIWEFLGLTSGESVNVAVWLDREERTIDVPAALQAALMEVPDGSALFARWSFTTRKEWALKFQPSARPDTLEKRRNLLREALAAEAQKPAKRN